MAMSTCTETEMVIKLQIPGLAFTHVQHHDDDESHERHKERDRKRVFAKHVAVEVTEHAHVEHCQKRLAHRPKRLDTGQKGDNIRLDAATRVKRTLSGSSS